MGIPPFLIASTLNISVAQRLVRKLCNSCKKVEELSSDELSIEHQKLHKIKNHYVATGCSECYQTGYKGRKAIYEIIPITKELVQNIQKKELDISEYLMKNKIATLQSNALGLVKNGTTSIDEIYSLLIS
jgi:type IV pilus assembly protein PilB